MNVELIINPTVTFYLSLFNDPINNSDIMASDWIIMDIDLERIWKNMS
jgi:hypothetical protein